MNDNTDRCRAAFESWFEPTGRGLERNANGGYKFMTAHAAWSAWRAGWEAGRYAGEDASA